MKAYKLFVLFAAMVFVISCKNENVQPGVSQSQIVARWRIAKDSAANLLNGALTNANVYVGRADDYYDFRADGKCYIHENGSFDTLAYKIVTDNSVAFGNELLSTINPLTSHSATIDFSFAQGPGLTTYSKTVFLTK